MKLNWAVFVFILSFGMASAAFADGIDDLGRLMGTGNGAASQGASPAAVAKSVRDPNILRLIFDKIHIIRLEEDAASVIVTNPAHATVMLDSPRLLVVMPRQPGATTFRVLNAEGREILVQEVVVTATEEKYVRVRRMCGRSDANCAPNAYYYCPDGCYEVQAVPGDRNASSVPSLPGGSAQPAGQGPVMPVQEPAPSAFPQDGSVEEEEIDEDMIEEQDTPVGDGLNGDGEPAGRR